MPFTATATSMLLLVLLCLSTGGAVESSPCVVDGRLFVGAFANALHAIDAETGDALWTSPGGVGRSGHCALPEPT